MSPTQTEKRKPSSSESSPSSAPDKPGTFDVAGLVPKDEPNTPTAGSSPEALESFLGAPVPADALDKNKDGPGKKPMLDFDESPSEREWVKLNGKGYEIRTLDEFGVRAQQRLTRDGREFSKLMSEEAELDDAMGTRLEMLMERTFDQLIVADDEAKASFSDAKRVAIIMGFMPAPLHQVVAMLRSMVQQSTESSEPTGESSSVD